MVDNSIELVGYYGSDETHALSAWTSTKRELTLDRRERLGHMLWRLANDGHHTPFEKSCLHFVVDCETASHIHMIKHRIGVSVNAESARYKEHKTDKWYVPFDWPVEWMARLDNFCAYAFEEYHKAVADLEPKLGRKRAKESARFFLPYASSITLDVSFNFRSFMLFQKLRNDDHAQQEIHIIAEDMLREVKETHAFDMSIAAFGY